MDDAQVSGALFAKAFDWAKERKLTEITGPRGLLRFDGTGLLVKGFEYPAMTGMAYNHPYYDALVKDSGFEKVADQTDGFADFIITAKVVERINHNIKAA